MSQMHPVEHQCHNCSKISRFDVYSSVNVTLDPSLKKQILDSSLFNWECPFCHEKYNWVNDFLYHDMDHHFMMFFDPDEIAEREYKEDTALPPMPPLFKIERYNLRQVHGLNRLKEKIKILDAGLDDIVVELLKLFTKVNNKELQECSIYFEAKEGDVLSFAFRNNVSEKWGTFDVPFAFYQKNQTMAEQTKAFIPAVGMSAEVNEGWIHEHIKRLSSSQCK